MANRRFAGSSTLLESRIGRSRAFNLPWLEDADA